MQLLKTLLLSGLLLLFLACSKGDSGTDQTTNPPNNQSGQSPDSGSDSDENPADDENTGGQPDAVDMEDFTAAVADFMANRGLKGGQVAITRNEKLVYLQSFGDADDETPVHDQSLFRVASISKPITVLAISRLVADGKLSMGDRVFGTNGLLGTQYGTPPYQDGVEKITVNELVEHKSGFKNEPYDIMFDEVSLSHQQLIDRVLDERTYVRSNPYYYSNFGYCLLGRVIEAVTGMSYEDYVEQKILSPMGISAMKIGGNTLDERFENEVLYNSSWFDPYAMNVTRMDAHGGWIASAKDLARIAVHSDTRSVVPDLLDFGDAESYLENGTYLHYGALPGTLAVLSVNSPFCYTAVFNTGNANYDSVLNAFADFMNDQITSRQEWPEADLF
ncbi:hypothetical protein RB2501_05320 [Robiginitalea biformata HTCC2501]|uniref:Beta-lactamase-related domain-containing protein n=2 Tax=Robiginitalea TaxID=252306 RepID=A4CH84_ROBBH|nr:hypothetical protein RB2501_05320 [Robiginitalea biformata HTCC2501]